MNFDSSNSLKEDLLMNFSTTIQKLSVMYFIFMKSINDFSNQGIHDQVFQFRNSNQTKGEKDNRRFEEKKIDFQFAFYIEPEGNIVHLLNLLNFNKFKFSSNSYRVKYDCIEQHKNFLYISKLEVDYKNRIMDNGTVQALSITPYPRYKLSSSRNEEYCYFLDNICFILFLERLPKIEMTHSLWNEKKGGMTIISNNYYMFAIGGFNHASALTTFEIYEEEEKIWKILSPLNNPDYEITALFVNPSLLFTFGGLREARIYEKLILDFNQIFSSRWFMCVLNNASYIRYFPIAFPLNENEILLFGQTTSNQFFPSFPELFKEKKMNLFDNDEKDEKNTYYNNNDNVVIFNINEAVRYEKKSTFLARYFYSSKPKQINDDIFIIGEYNIYSHFAKELKNLKLKNNFSNSINNDEYNKLCVEYSKSGYDKLKKEEKINMLQLNNYNYQLNDQMRMYILYINLLQNCDSQPNEPKYDEITRIYKINMKNLNWEELDQQF